MNKILLLFAICLSLLSSSVSAQGELDSLKERFLKLKKYQISNDSIRDSWTKIKLSFNKTCDIVSYEDRIYDLENFEPIFVKFINKRLPSDTIVVQMDYPDNLTIENMVKSYECIATIIEKQKNKGVYYITNYSEKIKNQYVKTDTLEIHTNKIVSFNGKIIEYATIADLLKTSGPEMLVLKTVSNLRVEDIADVLEITNKLNITIKFAFE